jgi:hypothetical protein
VIASGERLSLRLRQELGQLRTTWLLV